MNRKTKKKQSIHNKQVTCNTTVKSVNALNKPPYCKGYCLVITYTISYSTMEKIDATNPHSLVYLTIGTFIVSRIVDLKLIEIRSLYAASINYGSLRSFHQNNFMCTSCFFHFHRTLSWACGSFAFEMVITEQSIMLMHCLSNATVINGS